MAERLVRGHGAKDEGLYCPETEGAELLGRI